MRLLILASVLTVGFCMPGGWTQQNASDPQYLQILNELQSKNLITAMDSDSVTLLKVATQVVSGTNYNFTLQIGNIVCSIVYYEQTWTKTQEITSDTCSSRKRSSHQVGGYTEKDPNLPKYQAMLAKLSSSGMIALPMDANNYQLTGVAEQVVAGMNYKFSLTVNGQPCEIIYYVVSWQNHEEITKDTCSKLVQRRQLGGWSPVPNLTATGVQKCLAASLDRINAMSNGLYRLVESKIVSAQQQVVAGMKYRMTVQLTGSSCMNNDQSMGLTSVGCPANSNSGMQEMWTGECVYAPWLDPKVNVLSVSKGYTDVDITKGDSKNGKLLGGDKHDYVNHGTGSLVADTPDLVHDAVNLLGAVKPGLVQQAAQLVSEAKPDLMKKAENILRAANPDLIKDAENVLGTVKSVQDAQVLLRAAEPGLAQHAKKLLSVDKLNVVKDGLGLLGDNRDYVEHSKKGLIGQDGHDLQPHGKSAENVKQNCSALFEEFKKNHKKLYDTKEEEDARLKIFCDNMQRIKKFQEIEKGTARYGPTKFADLTKSEFSKYMGKEWDISAMKTMKRAAIPRGQVPDSFDWRDHGAVTEVKNQGSCGSCWAFSTTGNIEGQWAIQKKHLISLSEQELVDCDKIDEGCNGGLPTNAYKEIERLGGLETEKEYSYKGEDEKCVFKKRDVKVYINDSVSISSNETEMASWLFANGPISIGINAFAMQFYMGGISHPWSIFCNPSSLDHGVLIVGYGVQDGTPYWIIKNSWGPDWGEKGYYLVYRGGGVCGLNTMCTSSVIY